MDIQVKLIQNSCTYLPSRTNQSVNCILFPIHARELLPRAVTICSDSCPSISVHVWFAAYHVSGWLISEKIPTVFILP